MTLDRPFYKGPGAREWIFSLACTVLLAADIFVSRAAVLPHSAEAYYMALSQASVVQSLSIVLDICVLIATFVWIILPATANFSKMSMIAVSFLGVSLFWFEIFFAVKHGSGPVFVLRELPFRPLANYGILGSQVFATYLTFLIPSGKLPACQSFVVKLALSGCVLAYQFLIWDGIAAAAGRAS